MCVHHSQQQQCAVSCTVGCPCSPCPAVAGSPMIQLHQFMHPDLCTCHIHFTSTFESVHETLSLNTGGLPLLCVGDVCVVVVCVGGWLCGNKGEWQSSSVYWIWKFHQLSSHTHENLKCQDSQIWKETNWGALCQCVCQTVKKLTANTGLHLICNYIIMH